MDWYLGYISGLVCFAVCAQCDSDLKTSKWKVNATTEVITLHRLFTLPRASKIVCAGYCDNIPGCSSFAVGTASRICEGYSSNYQGSAVILHNDMMYYERNTGPQQYQFEHHTFTPCGTTGRYGPSLGLCQAAYGTQWALNSNYYDVVDGVQKWLVPKTGYYIIEATGAAGGNGNNGADSYGGGLGAKIRGMFFLETGTILNIVCGQMGTDGGRSEPGGGGGGSFVYEGVIGGHGLMIAAGGGGGAGEEFTRSGFDGQAGLRAVNCFGFTGSNTAGFGGLGYGGKGGDRTFAGAGWFSDGENIQLGDGSAGERWFGGTPDKAGEGGFGGGGSGNDGKGGGGGGGYTGGEGISDSDPLLWGGGGGGSYNTGTNQFHVSGFNTGHGHVFIEFIS